MNVSIYIYVNIDNTTRWEPCGALHSERFIANSCKHSSVCVHRDKLLYIIVHSGVGGDGRAGVRADGRVSGR